MQYHENRAALSVRRMTIPRKRSPRLSRHVSIILCRIVCRRAGTASCSFLGPCAHALRNLCAADSIEILSSRRLPLGSFNPRVLGPRARVFVSPAPRSFEAAALAAFANINLVTGNDQSTRLKLVPFPNSSAFSCPFDK